MKRQAVGRLEAGREPGVRVSPLLRYSILPAAMAGLTHLLSSMAGLLEGDTEYSAVLGLWAVLYLAVAAAWLLALKPSRSLSKEEALVLVGYSWVVTPLLSAIPVAYALGVPLVDAWFESISGYTTTGLTIFTGGVDKDFGVYVPSMEQLPPSILWWRAVTQWLGGFGIVVMFLVFARLGGLPPHLVGFAEGRFERLEPSIARSIRALMGLYAFLTLLGAILLHLAGMRPADALYHSMTGIATGGFSPYSDSIAHYHSVAVELATMVVMLLGAANFADLYAIIRGVPRRLSEETASLIVIAFASTLLGALILGRLGWHPYAPLREAAFDVASAVSTTGFGISDLSKAPIAWKAFLTVLMLVGGAAFSTAGGIKQYRLLVLFKNIAWTVRETVHGADRITVRRVGGSIITDDELRSIVSVATLFAAAHAAGTLALLVILPRCSLADAAFEAASALATTGLSVGVTSASTPWLAKAVLMALMTLGRLEVVGFLYMVEAARTMAGGARRRGRRAGLRPEGRGPSRTARRWPRPPAWRQRPPPGWRRLPAGASQPPSEVPRGASSRTRWRCRPYSYPWRTRAPRPRGPPGTGRPLAPGSGAARS